MKPSWDRSHCETCRFAIPYADTDAFLECRRYAPKSHAPEEVEPKWPIVMRTDWCGEWTSDLVAEQ